jgi:NitT/TauT family transport system substrate-binding protein
MPSIARTLLVCLFALFLTGAVRAADKVSIGLGGTAADTSFRLADDRGFFKEAGIEPNMIVLDSGAKQIAPLGTGEIDVGSGALSVGFYNAIAQKIGIRIVSDKGHTAPGYYYQSILIRKDLIDSGAFKSLADLKGKKMAFVAPGVTPLSVLNEAAKAGGIAYEDIVQTILNFPQQVVAFRNKAVDGSINIEPQATMLVSEGAAVRFMNTEDFYSRDQIAVVFFGEKFAAERPAVAQRFMMAYLKGLRFYRDAIKDGRLRGPNAPEVIKLIADRFKLDPKILNEMYAPAIDPDGKINIASLQKDLAFFRSKGMVTADIDLKDVVDTSFAEKAAAALGPYKPK